MIREMAPLLHQGSVKNIRGNASDSSLLFEFTDRYSVFDWGEMPDAISGKGLCLSVMGKIFFRLLENPLQWKNLFADSSLSVFNADYLAALEASEVYQKLRKAGLLHHALLNEEDFFTPYLKVKKVNLLRPPKNENGDYNYEQYKSRPLNALVPLEIIFRLGLPEGNSYSKRYNITPGKSLLQTPLIDFSTKLERGDRYLSPKEAKDISGMNEQEWKELETLTHLIGLQLFVIHKKMGLELWDGKVEMAFVEGENDNRSFMLVDSVGIDELRLLYKGKSFSKEFLREAYKNSEWYLNLEKAKKEAKALNLDFKKVCQDNYHSNPKPLAAETLKRAESVYKAYCNTLHHLMKGEYCFDSEFTLENYSARYL